MKLLLIHSTVNNGESNTIYRICIAYTEGKIIEVMLRGVFCVHKHGFFILGYIFIYFRIEACHRNHPNKTKLVMYKLLLSLY